MSNQIIFLKFEDERAVGKFRDVNTWVFNNTQYTEMAKNKILDNNKPQILDFKLIFVVILIVSIITSNSYFLLFTQY